MHESLWLLRVIDAQSFVSGLFTVMLGTARPDLVNSADPSLRRRRAEHLESARRDA